VVIPRIAARANEKSLHLIPILEGKGLISCPLEALTSNGASTFGLVNVWNGESSDQSQNEKCFAK
jgi:hypothetical protein